MTRRTFGLPLTVLWLCFVVIYLYIQSENLFQLSPNEFGDFPAGTVAPLAFLWLVIEYFQQEQELRQNTEA